MFVGLVKDPGGWRPPDDQPDPNRRRRPSVSWGIVIRALAWTTAFVGLFALVPVADHMIGPLAGYLLILLAVALGGWRLDRMLTAQYWRGLKDYQA
jgi:hypothetical protein